MDFFKAFNFLKKLSKNNNREWFEKHKPEFVQLKSEFEGFVATLYDECLKFDPRLAGQDPKKMVFRIYRDVRFSKDKKPYKDHLSASVSEAGRGPGKPGYYLHIQPGNKSFVCAGLYAPEAENLSKIRQEIDYNGEQLDVILKDKKFTRYYTRLWEGDQLKTVPKGYAKDHPRLGLLKLKSFVALHTFTDEEVKAKHFLKEMTKVIEAGKPVNDFIRQALD